MHAGKGRGLVPGCCRRWPITFGQTASAVSTLPAIAGTRVRGVSMRGRVTSRSTRSGLPFCCDAVESARTAHSLVAALHRETNMTKPLSIVMALLSFALAMPVAVAQSSGQIPMRDFFRNPDRAYFRISGDGRTLSFMQPWERRMNIYVQAVGSKADAVRITSEKDRDIPDYFWKGAD